LLAALDEKIGFQLSLGFSHFSCSNFYQKFDVYEGYKQACDKAFDQKRNLGFIQKVPILLGFVFSW
jgi:hypothetical protein